MLLTGNVQGTAMVPYYLFAFFIFVLLCLALLLWRFLLVSMKRKERLELELKEEELKSLLKMLRKEADDFFDLASDKTAEISEERKRIATLVASFALPQSIVEPDRDYYASERRLPEFVEIKPAQYSDFQRAIDEAAKKHNAAPEEYSEDSDKSEFKPISELKQVQEDYPVKPKPSKREQIIALLDSGMDTAQVAKELEITHSEINLVVRTRQ